MPIRVGGANGRGRHGIGIESQLEQRRSAPSCAKPVFCKTILPVPPAPAAQPDHGGARHSAGIIPRTRDNCNRHRSRDRAPVAPAMKLRQIVRPHQPDEAVSRISPRERSQGIGGIARAHFGLDRGNFDRRAARRAPRRGVACRQAGHAVCGFQNIAGRDQPPHFVETQRAQREQADAPVRTMRRVETAPEQPDPLAG